MLIPEDSPLRHLPDNLSRKQLLIFDGIRYAAEMADTAYARLFDHLQAVGHHRETEPTIRDIASAILDAWSIVDSVHRFRDLVGFVPGVANAPWKRLLHDRTADIAELRDCVQHQNGEVETLAVNGGQIWGYLSWAEIRDSRYTGKWLVMSPGAVFRGDKWFFIGPASSPTPLPLGRIRLTAFGREVYLGKSIVALQDAVNALTEQLAKGLVRPVGDPATIERRGSDVVYEGCIEVLVSSPPLDVIRSPGENLPGT